MKEADSGVGFFYLCGRFTKIPSLIYPLIHLDRDRRCNFGFL